LDHHDARRSFRGNGATGCTGGRHSRVLPPVSLKMTESGARWGQRTRPATKLIVIATMTTPNNHDSSAWRKTTRRIAFVVRLVSDTWNVMPTVNATYAKS